MVMMKNWLMFIAAGVIWGSSFLLIKNGVQELTPLQLVSGRLGFSALAYAAAMIVLRKRIPSDNKSRLYLMLLGITNTAIPFLFITWAEQRIDSGLAGVLNATVPLFSIVIAHLTIHDDKFTTGKIAGLITGFIGIVLLWSRSIDPTHANPIEGLVAMLVATFCYASSAVIIRLKLRHVDPITTGGVTMFVGGFVVIMLTLLFERPLPIIANLSTDVKLAVVTLAFLNTFVANTLYLSLIKSWGASRSTMVTYLMPPISVVLGAVFGQERIDLLLVIGAAFIVGGVALANWRRLGAQTTTSIPTIPKETLTETPQPASR
jgi:drug/metabolite transporter (DMT)-like permease